MPGRNGGGRYAVSETDGLLRDNVFSDDGADNCLVRFPVKKLSGCVK